MTIIESKDFSGNEIVTIIDEAKDSAESMTKAEYERRQAALSETETI
jgi:hypothetical protein